MVFENLEAARAYYNAYARRKGFSIQAGTDPGGGLRWPRPPLGPKKKKKISNLNFSKKKKSLGPP